MAVERKHKRITIANPNEFMLLARKKASSNPLRKKLSIFIEAVIVMAQENNTVADIRSANTLVPGHAKVGGSETPVFGYLWESVAFPATEPEMQVMSSCFLTVNERELFDRMYGNNEAAPLAMQYSDFVPREELPIKKEA
jgi:hypothetical protein